MRICPTCHCRQQPAPRHSFSCKQQERRNRCRSFMRLPFAPCLQRSGLPTPPRSVRQTQDIEASPHHTTTTILPPPLPPPPLPTTTATSAITAIKLGTSRCQRLEAEVTVLRVECVRPLAEPSRVPSEARVSDEEEGFLRVSSVSLASSTCSSPGSHALCLIL